MEFEARAAARPIHLDEEFHELALVPLEEWGFGRAGHAVERLSDVHLRDAPPVEKTRVQLAALAPEPGVVQIQVPVAEGDAIRGVVEILADLELMLENERSLGGEPLQEIG